MDCPDKPGNDGGNGTRDTVSANAGNALDYSPNAVVIPAQGRNDGRWTTSEAASYRLKRTPPSQPVNSASTTQAMP